MAETSRSALTAQSGHAYARGAVQNRASLSKIHFLYFEFQQIKGSDYYEVLLDPITVYLLMT